jgi:hypothetical protein
MDCPKCRTPLIGFGKGCTACGHSGANFKRAMLWIATPTALVVAALGASIAIDAANRTGSSRNPFSNAIEVEHEAGRSRTFAKLMHDVGEQCASTSKTMFRGDIGTNATWAIRCRDTGDWLILIAQNGATRVSQCVAMEKISQPCWMRV